MPRNEKPIDGIGPGALFALDLRVLKHNAGLTYRGLSERAHVSASALSRAANGKKPPTWEVVQAYVRACGGDVPTWRARWESISAGVPHD